MVTIKATIFFEKTYWVGIFERTDKQGFSAAKHIFGGEPSDIEIHEFILTHYSELKFGVLKELSVQIKRMNPKRMQREVRREMERTKETLRPSTFAQDYMKEELEKQKKVRNSITSLEKQAHQDKLFAIKQLKKKEKHKGH